MDSASPCPVRGVSSFGIRLCNLLLQFTAFFLIAPGAAISQVQPGAQSLCTSSQMLGGMIFIPNILENTAPGTVIANLGIQGGSDDIQLTTSQEDSHVAFDPFTQSITVVRALDREEASSIDIKINCLMKQMGFQLDIPVKIAITDVNDNPPVFVDDPYEATVNELTPVGTPVLPSILATDRDADNWKITYEVVNDTVYSEHFGFPIETSGSLVLLKPINFEEVQTVKLTIMARDHHQQFVSGQPQEQMISTAVTTVVITDGDDQNPVFIDDPYLATVVENAPIDTVLEVRPTIRAYDPDIGFNATVEYAIVEDTLLGDSAYFTMDPANGRVSLKNDALRRGAKFSLLIQAAQTDNPERITRTSLRIIVQSANENEPRFVSKLYSTSLVENVPAGSYVTTVEAIDNDEGTLLEYSFPPNIPVTDFNIDSRTGEIRTSQPLSFETRANYNITVQVTDGRYFDYAFVEVTLLNTNNHNPQFGNMVYNFGGFRERGFIVGTIQATDLDVNSVIKYGFIGNTSHFTVTADGDVVITGNPDELVQPIYYLAAVAEDEGVPPRKDSAMVVVTFEGGTLPVVAEGQTNLVVIIILGVLAGCLLLIIVVLCIYIYRKYKRRKSFERGINEVQRDYRPYVQAGSDPEGLAYKPTGHHDRHLAIYNDIPMGEDGTTIQQNPFKVADRDSSMGSSTNALYAEPHVSRGEPVRRYNAGSYSGYRGDHFDSNPNVSEDSIAKNYSDMTEIDYDTAVTPIDHYNDPRMNPYGRHIGGRQGVVTDPNSYVGSTNSLSTFKVGSSRQRLVGPDVSPRSSGSESSSHANLRKGSSVSFIDDHQVNVYHPDNAINPRGSQGQDKPEITVYY